MFGTGYVAVLGSASSCDFFFLRPRGGAGARAVAAGGGEA